MRSRVIDHHLNLFLTQILSVKLSLFASIRMLKLGRNRERARVYVYVHARLR